MDSAHSEYKEILTLVFKNKEAIAIFNLQLTELIQKHNDIQIIVKELRKDQVETVHNFETQKSELNEQRLQAFLNSIIVVLKYVGSIFVGILGYFAMKFCDKYFF